MVSAAAAAVREDRVLGERDDLDKTMSPEASLQSGRYLQAEEFHDVVDFDEGAHGGHACFDAFEDESRAPLLEVGARVAFLGFGGVGEGLGEGAGGGDEVGVLRVVG